MKNLPRITLFALLLCAGVAVVVLDVGWVSGQQEKPKQLAGTCADGCQIQWEGCSAGAAGDADIQAVCDEQKTMCIAACGSGSPTTVSIKLDKPDPSQPGQSVTVHVYVVGEGHPTGTVAISGASVNCTCTLNPAAIGHCSVVFNSPGTYTLTATYSGDGTHNGSSDTDTHTVQ